MEFLNPAEILKKIKLEKNMTAADFGSGSGGWVIPLAKILEDGRVYAVDILEEPLSALRSRAKLEKLFNIVAIKANVEKGVRLPNDSCDLVLMTNLLFEAGDGKKAIIEEGKRVLRKGGRLLIVDWKPGQLGPQEKVSREEIKEATGGTGLKLEKEFDAGSYHYGLILVK
jgi:ubiquinone/menaquinone biosynthesis C-methylase UbiE